MFSCPLLDRHFRLIQSSPQLERSVAHLHRKVAVVLFTSLAVSSISTHLAAQYEIQSLIDAAEDGDTLLVTPGEYVITGPIDFKGKAITLRAENGPEETTIRMSDTPAERHRASVVIFENGEREGAVLEGFTLTGGKQSGVYFS